MAAMHIEVLRLSHRLPRDERISTHVALVARAFGAASIAYTGQHDAGFELSVSKICENWGGRTQAGSGFSVSYEKSAVSFIKSRKRDGFAIIHLTMYGLPVQDVVPEIKGREKLLIIVGSEQVPGEIYALADYNASVTNQPHSEVAALAITLDRIMGGRELGAGGGDSGFDFGGKLKVVPCGRGKRFADSGRG
jgi:tRNA (cytidine56-2'-O)-methyltransferase